MPSRFINCITDRFEFFREIAPKVTVNEYTPDGSKGSYYRSINFGKAVCSDSLCKKQTKINLLLQRNVSEILFYKYNVYQIQL